MATLGGDNLNLMDVARRLDPDGQVPAIVELLMQTNEILQDISWMECNNGTNHSTTVRTGLPSNTWRKLYQGVDQSKSSTKQVSDTTGMLESLAVTDSRIYQNSSDPGGLRLSEEAPFLESLGQDVVETLFFGDVLANPERFTGLHERYIYVQDPAIVDDTLASYNVFDGGGTGTDNTSIWLVTWGPMTCHGLFPEGSTAGISVKDFGEELTADANGKLFPAFRTHYKFDTGISVRDWRAVGRIANVDISALESETAAADLIRLMIRVSERVHTTMGRPIWYMHERVKTFLRIQALNHSNTNFTFDTVEGHPRMQFDGTPVHLCDQLFPTETQLAVQP